MNVILWIIAAVLSVLFIASGALKLVRTKEQLITSGLAWAEGFSAGAVRVIGVLEILGAVGLVVPWIAPVLVPLAALGLALLMAGALITHLRRREPQGIAVTLALLALTAFVAWGRFF